jgi:hypothetical protein
MKLHSVHQEHIHVRTLAEARQAGPGLELRSSKLPPRIPGFPYEVCQQCGCIVFFEGDELTAEAAGHYDRIYKEWTPGTLRFAGLLERARARTFSRGDVR